MSQAIITGVDVAANAASVSRLDPNLRAKLRERTRSLLHTPASLHPSTRWAKSVNRMHYNNTARALGCSASMGRSCQNRPNLAIFRSILTVAHTLREVLASCRPGESLAPRIADPVALAERRWLTVCPSAILGEKRQGFSATEHSAFWLTMLAATQARLLARGFFVRGRTKRSSSLQPITHFSGFNWTYASLPWARRNSI